MDNMYKLIKKELIFFKGTMRMQFIISLLFVTIFPLISTNFMFMGSMIIPYFAIYGAMAYEERSRGEVLMATLPISRKELCLSKYILGMIYNVLGVLISIICVSIGEKIMPGSDERMMIISNIVEFGMMMISIGMIYIAIILPILLNFGTEKSRYIMLLLYIGIFALSGAFGGILEEVGAVDAFQGMIGTATGMLLVGILLYILSISISTKILMNKEF